MQERPKKGVKAAREITMPCDFRVRLRICYPLFSWPAWLPAGKQRNPPTTAA
jgi:hypothetical protein